MASLNPLDPRDVIARELASKAAALWGPHRAEQLRTVLEGTADHLWTIAQNLPDEEQEPGFFL